MKNKKIIGISLLFACSLLQESNALRLKIGYKTNTVDGIANINFMTNPNSTWNDVLQFLKAGYYSENPILLITLEGKNEKTTITEQSPIATQKVETFIGNNKPTIFLERFNNASGTLPPHQPQQPMPSSGVSLQKDQDMFAQLNPNYNGGIPVAPQAPQPQQLTNEPIDIKTIVAQRRSPTPPQSQSPSGKRSPDLSEAEKRMKLLREKADAASAPETQGTKKQEVIATQQPINPISKQDSGTFQRLNPNYAGGVPKAPTAPTPESLMGKQGIVIKQSGKISPSNNNKLPDAPKPGYDVTQEKLLEQLQNLKKTRRNLKPLDSSSEA